MARFARFDLLFLRRLVHLVKFLFPLHRRSYSFYLAVTCVVLALVDQVVTYFVGILPSRFLLMLGKRDQSGFQDLAFKATLIVLLKAAVASLSLKLAAPWLYLKCRERLNTKIHRLYFKRQAFYKLNALGDNLDNPDQRMTQDIEKVASLLTNDLLVPVLVTPLIIVYYTYLTYESAGWVGPIAIYGYFVIATAVNKFLLSPIVGLVQAQERHEGFFRRRHMEVLRNAEPIAFFHAGLVENVMTNRVLFELINVQRRLLGWRLALGASTNVFDYFSAILSYLIIALPIFGTDAYQHMGEAEITEVVSRNAFYYMYLIYQFTSLIGLSEKIGDMAGVTHRVMELVEELQRLHADCLEIERPPSTVPSSVVAIGGDEDESNAMKRTIEELHGRQLLEGLDAEEEAELLLGENGATPADGDWNDDGVAITADLATLATPNDPTHIVICHLSLQIATGRSVLISGDSGLGKTSVLRMLAGLWHVVMGKVSRHWKERPSQTLFLPQRTYMPTCSTTLRQQIVYPVKALAVAKDVTRLRQILEQLRLEHLIERCRGFDSPVEWDWNEGLSPGEQQRLALARVFYHRPRVAFLDESTSAIGFDMETTVYDLLVQRGITLVSVGHRASLRRWHDVELRVGCGAHGEWQLSNIEDSSTGPADSSLVRSPSPSSRTVSVGGGGGGPPPLPPPLPPHPL